MTPSAASPRKLPTTSQDQELYHQCADAVSLAFAVMKKEGKVDPSRALSIL